MHQFDIAVITHLTAIVGNKNVEQIKIFKQIKKKVKETEQENVILDFIFAVSSIFDGNDVI
jgi:hypothetical protein